MLGTYSPVTALDWAVVVQKPRLKRIGAFEMQHGTPASAARGAGQHDGGIYAAGVLRIR
jgi:hypothetical protein